MRLILHFEGQILLPQHPGAETDCYLVNTVKLLGNENYLKDSKSAAMVSRHWVFEKIIQSPVEDRELHIAPEDWDRCTKRLCISCLV